VISPSIAVFTSTPQFRLEQLYMTAFFIPTAVLRSAIPSHWLMVLAKAKAEPF